MSKPLTTVWWPCVKTLALDLETTGVNRKRDRIRQIGLAGNCVTQALSLVIDPEADTGHAPEDLKGVTQGEWDAIAPFRVHATTLAELIAGSVLVLHNKSGDLAFLENEFARCGMPMPAFARVVCTQQLCRSTKTPGRHGLSAVCSNLNIPPPTIAHNAKYDADATYRLYITLLNRHPDHRHHFFPHELKAQSVYFLNEQWVLQTDLRPCPK